MTGTVPTNLPAAPIFKHPDQEDEAEGGVLVTIREDAPLDFRARACNNRLGVRGGRRTSGRGPGVLTGTTLEDTSSTLTVARITATPGNLIC